MNPCNVKQLYDSQFEADRASAIAEHDFKTEFTAYQCGSHWHIANKDRSLRSKVRTFHKSYCEACNTYMRPKRYATHLLLAGHQRNARKQQRDG